MPYLTRQFPLCSLSLLLTLVTAMSAQAYAATCDSSKPKDACDIIVDPSAIVNGRTFHLRNGTPVTLRVQPKSPFDKCSITTKDRQTIAEENAFQTFLSSIAQAGLPITFLGRAVGAQANAKQVATNQALVASQQLARNPILTRIDERLTSIEELEKTASDDLTSKYASVQGFVGRIDDLRKNPSRGKTSEADKISTFSVDRSEFLADLLSAKPALALPDSTDISDGIAEVAKLINDNREAILGADPNWDRLTYTYQRLALARSTLGSINEAIASLGAARTKLYAQRDFLASVPVEFSAVFQYSDVNSVVRQEVSCVDRQSGDATTMGTVLYSIEFRDLARATGSLGILISTLDKREIGALDVKDTQSATGFDNVFGETDRAGLQIIPFSYLNVRILDWRWRGRDIVFGLAEGFGINPNNGGKDPEFFSGISIGIKDVYLHVGGHHGKWQELGGGFGLGDTVPEKLSTVPVQRRYTTHWGIGISFRLPPAK